jgi:hypothetical protein
VTEREEYFVGRWARAAASVRSIATKTTFQVATGILLVAIIVAGVALVLGASAKDIVIVATAIAGLSTIAVGLALAKDAFKLLYDKEAHQRASRAPGSSHESALTSVASSVSAASLPGVQIDLNTLLPTLIKTAAGLAVAVLLFGVLLLTGASFSTSVTGTPPSPSASMTGTTEHGSPATSSGVPASNAP